MFGWICCSRQEVEKEKSALADLTKLPGEREWSVREGKATI
jgi:hypothetical protein